MWKLLSKGRQLHKHIIEYSEFDTTAVSLSVHVDSQFSDDGRVSRQGLGRQVVVAVGTVQEGLAALAVARQVGMQNQTWARGRLRVWRTAAQWRAILHFKAKRKERERRNQLNKRAEETVSTFFWYLESMWIKSANASWTFLSRLQDLTCSAAAADSKKIYQASPFITSMLYWSDNHLHRPSNHRHHLSAFNQLPLSTGLCNTFTNSIQERGACINPKMITHPSIHGLKTKLLCSLNKYALLVSERRGCLIVNWPVSRCSTTHSSPLSGSKRAKRN